MFRKKAQSAMEYLMTYGWAILIVLIALAALFYLGVFSPSTPNVCTVSAPFTCTDIKATDSSNALEIKLGASGLSEATYVAASFLKINGVTTTCTVATSNDGDGLGNFDGNSDTLELGGSTVSFICSPLSPIISATATLSKFSGTATFSYKLQGSSIAHTAVVSFSGKEE